MNGPVYGCVYAVGCPWSRRPHALLLAGFLPCVEEVRPRVHRDQIFVRYASPERRALQSFSFLDRWASQPLVRAAASPSASPSASLSASPSASPSGAGAGESVRPPGALGISRRFAARRTAGSVPDVTGDVVSCHDASEVAVL